jgi:hypothetical protein
LPLFHNETTRTALLNKGTTTVTGRLIFSSDRDKSSGNYDLYLLDISTLTATRVTSNTSTTFGGVFSPDGQRIAFISHATGADQLYVMNADGTGQHQLTTSPSVTNPMPFGRLMERRLPSAQPSAFQAITKFG